MGDTVTELQTFTCHKNSQDHLGAAAAGEMAFQKIPSSPFPKLKALLWYVLRVFHINPPGEERAHGGPGCSLVEQLWRMT